MSMWRIISILAILALPLAGPGMPAVVAMIACARTAYIGPRTSVVYDMFGALLGVELIYGIPLGTVSLAYLTAAIALVILQRFLVLSPWPLGGQWHMMDGVRIVCISVGLYGAMWCSGVVIERLI
jgi:hypothetical protein